MALKNNNENEKTSAGGKTNTRKEPKKPRRITASYLHNAGLYYLERFSSSANNFKRVMKRKIDTSAQFYEENPSDYYKLLDELIEKMIRLGLLNDEVYARARVTSLRRKGGSRRKIVLNLQEKGINADQTLEQLDALDSAHYSPFEAELQAALAHIKRRRIGPYRNRPDERSSEKDLASLARSGYSYDIAHKALALSYQQQED